MNLGEHIYNLRSQRNLSQGDLADALGVSRQSISKWENNSAVPELDKLVKLSELFDVTLDELVRGKRPEPRSTDAVSGPTPFPARQIIGILALIVCFIVIMVTCLAGNMYGIHYDEGIFLALLFAVLGTLCLKPGSRKSLLWYLPFGCIVLFLKSTAWLPVLFSWIGIVIGVVLIVSAFLPKRVPEDNVN